MINKRLFNPSRQQKKNIIPIIRKHRRIQFYFLALFLLLFFGQSAAQSVPDDLSNVRVEELTDDQLRRFVLEMNRLNVSSEQMEQLALQRGMNTVEVVKLKEKVQSFRKSLTAPNLTAGEKRRAEDSIVSREKKPIDDFNAIFTGLQSRNFGFDVFNNPALTFEPNLHIPTPKNYQLAADDELLIDVSGYSEASYRLKVSPEGVIRIPVAGPVPVNGLTIEQAKKNITRKLASTIYSNINSGKTSVEVTLASIRSIKVNIIGEATLPGTYTLPSLASAYNALYACGGPNLNGSFRNIQVIRNNTTVSTIDVYEYLATGSKNHDIRLMDQDIIKINPYVVRIELKGEVKKPGLYDVAPGETIADILQYAGGFTDNAYTARIQVFKNTSKDRQVITVAENELATSFPGRGDTYIIGKILNRFSNRVSIRGAVYRPGEYELKEKMTLSQLINEADGIREDAFTSRINIHRLKDDLSPGIISVDLEKLLKKEISDISLKPEDRITIFSKFDLKEGFYVTVEGEVSSPGVYLYEEGMSVQDLIMLAGGFKESASMNRIEISRRVKDADPSSLSTQTALIFQQDIMSDLRDSTGKTSFTLLPFDEVSIHPSPGYSTQKNAVIEGEIIYSGKYSLQSKGDRISDLVKRAGGLTPQAYLEGAVLVRTRNFTKSEQENYEQGVNNLIKQNYQSGTDPALLQYQYTRILQKKTDYVGIDLNRILANPLSKYDLLLNDGDTLRIPKQLQTVRINGEVLYPALVRFDKNMNFKDYIIGSGGFGERSSKKRSYVVYANGSVKGTKSFLFFKNYPGLKPGAEIYVPIKKEREKLRTGEIITIGATLISMLAILVNVSN
jgi:protein involved in polysaccharide export with SLBB domain